jgi:PKHD-type hydroxylase
MANENAQKLPPFQNVATATGFMTDEEMDRLIAEHEAALAEGKLGAGDANADVRRSKVAFLGKEQQHQWLYERIWAAAQECNRLFFCVDIAGVEANVQLARYDSSNRGFYDWHTDFAGYRPLRKISISIQLSRPEDYEGGDLELMVSNRPQPVERARGAFIAFPSFALHRVTPVTRGTRWSLVAWVLGPRWR